MINFIIAECRIYSRLKLYKNYKNRLSLAKVIVKNKLSRFFMVHCVHYTGQLLNSSLVQFGFGTCEQWPPQPTFKNGLSQIDQSLKLSRALPDCAEMFLGWCFMGWPAVVGTGGLIIHLSLFLVIETVGRMSMAILKRRYAF